MLTKDQKKEIVENLSKEIIESKTVVICNYKGLDVEGLSNLRKELRENKAMITVTKKTLAKLAFKKAGIDMNTKDLEGQLAFVCGGEDEITTPKILAKFAKDNENLQILSGSLEKEVISDEEILNLSKLPGREELLAKVVYCLKSPINGFAQALAGNLRNLVFVLNAVKEGKEEK
jgi:large subunit ribosomal protein L10